MRSFKLFFDSLDDESLLTALQGQIRRGPKGYPIAVLWHCYITKYYLGLDSTASLLRNLRYNPFLAAACGLTDDRGIPSEPTMSRLFKKLSSKHILPRLKDVSRSIVRRNYAELPGFGQRVALDSSTLKAWSNGGKTPKADPDAGWSVKTNTHGKQEYTYGYKLHLAVDCEYQLPVAANVSAGNVHDVTRATNLLSEARFTEPTFNPRFVIADKGYASPQVVQGDTG